jgi:hypothetical protein
MTKNLDLARACGAHAIPAEVQVRLERVPACMVLFAQDQLDAFAERIRAESAACISELEAQLEAIGAGGVSALMPTQTEYRPLTLKECDKLWFKPGGYSAKFREAHRMGWMQRAGHPTKGAEDLENASPGLRCEVSLAGFDRREPSSPPELR